MGRKETFYYTSSSGKTKIHAVRYIPDGEIKAIVQISHGMVEHIERYKEFALFLNSKGILVTGNDHLGHGKSINSPKDFGFFAKENGNLTVLYDVYQLTQLTKEQYPNVPYFLLGHSMGSFYARQYLCQFGHELDGVILMGSGFPPLAWVQFGRILVSLIACFTGWRYRCFLINQLAYGSYNKHFTPTRTTKDWLTKDSAKVDEFIADKRCNFIFTLNAHYAMFTGISRLYNKKLLSRMPKDLPVLFLSGKEDPVGDYGKGIARTVQSFKKAGMKNVKVKLYPGDRHEILHETDRDIVYKDICRWLFSCLQ